MGCRRRLHSIGATLASLWKKPFRFGTTVLAARHADVVQALDRDLDFRIAPVNADRIDEVNGPFVLGMDRGAVLISERRALYSALGKIDLGPLCKRAQHSARERASGVEVDVVDGFARPIAGATASALFGVARDDPRFLDVARAVFQHTFLNISGDRAVAERALRAAQLMHDWFAAEIARRRADGYPGSDMMGVLLTEGALDDDGVRRTLGGMLVGAIDTTASSVAKIVSVLSSDRALLARARADVDVPERLAGWCREALRFWPHNPALLRQAAVDTELGGTQVRAGDRVALWTQAAMQDRIAFPRPSELHPDRPASAYLHFGGGLHPCAGRAVNAWQIPLLVGALLRRGIVRVGPVGWAGPFPAHMNVRLGADAWATRWSP